MPASAHLDLDAEMKKKRKGWFVKSASDMPAHKDYHRSCKRGFLGPNTNAHHILPKEAFDESGEGFDAVMIRRVKHITDYILNRPSNMIGLPSFWSYDVWYGDKQYPGQSKAWRSSYGMKTLAKWRRWIAKPAGRANPSPENHPVHLPVSWGHLPYTAEVVKKLTRLWNGITEDADRHKIKLVDFEKFGSSLASLEESFYSKLKGRGRTSQKRWERRADKDDDDWYGPYTMTDIGTNPIWK
jgi:hypothetical protein